MPVKSKPRSKASESNIDDANAERKKNVFKKLYDFMNENFSNVFSREHWVYTVIFFLFSIFLAFLQLFQKSNSDILAKVSLFVSATLVVTYYFMFMIVSLGHEKYILHCRNWQKVVVFLVMFGSSLILIGLGYYITRDFPVQYRFEIAVPFLYVAIFFAWNFIQIFYIRKGFEDIAFKIEEQAYKPKMKPRSKVFISAAHHIFAIIIPFIGQAVLLIYLTLYDESFMKNLVIDNTFGQIIYFSWALSSFILLGLGSAYLYMLYRSTIRHDTPSVFAPAMHLLFWIYILFRGFCFINAIQKAFAFEKLSYYTVIVDALIMIISLFLLFKGLGKKLSRVSLFTKNNLPFIAYLFATIIVMGQISLILGVLNSGTFPIQVPLPIISATSNLMMMSIAIIYYFLYLKRKLMQENYLEKDTFMTHEVIKFLSEYNQIIKNNLEILDEGFVDSTLKNYLLEKNLVLESTDTKAEKMRGDDETRVTSEYPLVKSPLRDDELIETGETGVDESIREPPPIQRPIDEIKQAEYKKPEQSIRILEIKPRSRQTNGPSKPMPLKEGDNKKAKGRYPLVKPIRIDDNDDQ
ncbi:MAG: hypothetical protein ACTSWN_09195 [Promethearchaeota archaeon]